MWLREYRYRGRHRAPTHAGRNAARVAVTGAALAVPLGISTPAFADPPGGWDPIIKCESGGNPRATNKSSTASGLFQFLDGTWESVGGEGRARDASRSEQLRRANILFEREGLSPWNASKSCWGSKVARADNDGDKKAEKKAGKKADDERSKDDSEEESVKIAPAANISPENVYTVRPGDTLTDIARNHGDGASTWPKLFALNRDVLDDPNMIVTGEQIRLK